MISLKIGIAANSCRHWGAMAVCLPLDQKDMYLNNVKVKHQQLYENKQLK